MNNLTFVVTFRDGHGTIENTLDSIPSDAPIIVVDDLSEVPYQTNRKNVRVIRHTTRGYPAGACNTGMSACSTDVILMGQDNALNGDEWQKLVGLRDRYGIIGDGVMGHPAWRRGYVQATWMLIRRDVIQKVGLFNDRDYPAWGCTAEYQLRACRAGFSVLPTRIPGLEHHRSNANYGNSLMKAIQDNPSKRDWLIRTPPMISVVIPCYNYGKYLSDAINSLLGGPTSLGLFKPQTFQSFEIIIVDDCSTDDSLKIAQSYADDWKGIRVYRNPRNVGTAETINNGIKQAFGKFVTVLSADDMFTTGRLERLYRILEKNPHQIVYEDVQTFGHGKLDRVMPMMEYDFDKLLYKNCVPASVMYPRQAWVEAGGYPSQFKDGREDWAFAVAVGAKGYCGIHLREPLFLYRRERQNRTVHNNTVDWARTYAGRMRETFPDLYRGEKPIMCCGSSKSKQNQPLPNRKLGARVMPLVGASGMELIEYLGQASGPMGFTGQVTGTAYLFGGKRKQGYVASEDLDGFLDIYHNQRALFRRVPKVAKPVVPVQAVEVKPEPQAETIIIDKSDGISESEASQAAQVLEQHREETAETEKPKRGRRSRKND